MANPFEICKFNPDQYENWAPTVAAFIEKQDPTAPPDFYAGGVLETDHDAIHYGLFVENEILAVAGLCQSQFDTRLDKHLLYILVGELGAETPKSLLLRFIERETHRAGYPLLTALIDTDEYSFFSRNGYKPRRVDPEDRPEAGLLYMCKYIWVDQVARVPFAQARSA